MATFAEVQQSLSLPLIAAPMTGVSGPELVIAACLAGIAGSFPTGNCRSIEDLDHWFSEIQSKRAQARDEGKAAGSLSANIIIRGNKRIAEDITSIIRNNVDFVITSVGSPKDICGPLNDAGICVLADVASMHHAERALEAGAGGLVLLSAGAGGHTGWANGFAFVRAVRAMYDGPLVLAGGVSDGVALWGAQVLGYDLAYMGTRFIPTTESMASPEWKQTLIDIEFDEIEVGIAANGVAASMIKGGRGSAGHTVSAVKRIMSTREVVEETAREYAAARAATLAALTT
ncbi:MAG: nitronate monooxygenase [bacterium]